MQSKLKRDRFAFALPILHPILVTTLLFLFTWPAATATPHNVQIGIVAPEPVAEQVIQMLEERQPDAFEATIFESAGDAQFAIRDRQIYGAVDITKGVEVQIASGANPNVAQMLTTLGETLLAGNLAMQGIEIPKVVVTDLAPLPELDPRGLVFASATLPIVIGGIALGGLVAVRVRGRWAQLSVVGSSALLTGAALAWSLSSMLGALSGEFWSTALVLSATLAAIAFPLVAAHRLMGMPGFGAIAATLFLLGNPLSGVSLPPEFYPSFWGQVGQSLPIGAGFDALRSVSFFAGADSSTSLWVLGIWVLAALAVWLIPVGQKEETSQPAHRG